MSRAQPKGLRARFLEMDDRLARVGVPPLTAWWRGHVGSWLEAYEAGGALEFWACAGRGSAKSTAVYKLALFVSVFCAFEIPVGERHFAIVMSRLKEEAAKGVAIIDRWLDLLAVPHHLAGDVIELDAAPRGIRVVAASVAAASGWRAYFLARDERSKWAASGLDEHDADEIDASAAAMTATHERAPVVTVGSAWGAFGSFFDAIQGGTTADRVVAGPAATWVAAPHITRESTQKKERDPRRWRREYACEFQASALAAFDSDAIARAFAEGVPETYSTCSRVLLVDPSAGASDTFAWGIAGWRLAPVSARYVTRRKWSTAAQVSFDEIVHDEGGQPIENPAWSEHPRKAILEFTSVDGIDNAMRRGITADQVVRHLVDTARVTGCVAAHSDQFERYALAAAFKARGLAFFPHSWTQPSKERAVERVRRWLGEGQVALPEHKRLRQQLGAFAETFSPSGALTFRGRANTHDDFAMLLPLAAFVDIEGQMPGSPIGSNTVVRDLDVLEAM